MTDWVKDGRDHPCPACKTAILKPSEGHSASFWSCPRCDGVFIGRQELFHYVEGNTQNRAAAMEFWALLKQALAKDVPDGSNLRACCICSTPLERFGYGERPMVIADRCPNDHGLWLDDGDLEKVIRCARVVATLDADGRRPSPAPGVVSRPQWNPEDPMVCPNCRRRYPETDADARCDDCNVALFRS